MERALGFLEISGVVAAVDALDIMCKTSDIELVTWERRMGGRLITLIVRGDVSAVTEAVETAAKSGLRPPVSTAVIANPHPEILKIIQKSVEVHFKDPANRVDILTQSDIQEK